MKTSITKRINSMTVLSIILLSLVLLCINLAIIGHYSREDSKDIMENTCALKVQDIDYRLKLVEQSVKDIYDIAEMIRPTVNEMASIKITEEYINNFQKMALIVASNTEGTMSVYFRLNP